MTNSIFPIISLMTMLSCQVVHESTRTGKVPAPKYTETTLPIDTADLWVSDGDRQSDTVLIICQGGPSKHLGFVEEGRTSYRYIPNYAKYSIVYLHQTQTYNKAIFFGTESFTLKMAEREVEHTVEMLSQAIKYFKDKINTVVVIGNSYGAFIVTNYLASGPALADKYVVIAGRIDDDTRAVEAHSRGVNGTYETDGSTFVSDKEIDVSNKYSQQESTEYRVKQLLKAAIGKPRYSQELSDKDLSNLVYFYATNDTQVGALSPAEIKFLKAKQVQLFETSDGHAETLYRFIDRLRDKSLRL